jgi:hypothetical protein
MAENSKALPLIKERTNEKTGTEQSANYKHRVFTWIATISI